MAKAKAEGETVDMAERAYDPNEAKAAFINEALAEPNDLLPEWNTCETCGGRYVGDHGPHVDERFRAPEYREKARRRG